MVLFILYFGLNVALILYMVATEGLKVKDLWMLPLIAMCGCPVLVLWRVSKVVEDFDRKHPEWKETSLVPVLWSSKKQKTGDQ